MRYSFASLSLPDIRSRLAIKRLDLSRFHAGDSLVALLFVSIGLLLYVCFGNARFYQENALFEFGQNILLLMGCVAFFIATSRAASKICHSIMWGLTLFCTSLFFRELEVRGTMLEAYLEVFFQHRIHYLLLLVFWSILLLVAFADFKETWDRALQWGFSRSGVWLLVGVGFYITGDMAEKNFFTREETMAKMIEESLELLATLNIFCAGYVTLRRQETLTTSLQTLSPDGER